MMESYSFEMILMSFLAMPSFRIFVCWYYFIDVVCDTIFLNIGFGQIATTKTEQDCGIN